MKKLHSKIKHDKYFAYKDMHKKKHTDSKLHHKIKHDKVVSKHYNLEKAYAALHKKYAALTHPHHKKRVRKNIERMHEKVVASRKHIYHDHPQHHDFLHKLFGTKSKNELHMKMHEDRVIDKSTHEIVDTSREVEHRKQLKHVVAPVKSHVFSDIGRGLKSIGIGLGEVGAVGLSRAGKALQAFAKRKGDTGEVSESHAGIEDIRG